MEEIQLFKPGTKADAIRKLAEKQVRQDVRREWWTKYRARPAIKPAKATHEQESD